MPTSPSPEDSAPRVSAQYERFPYPARDPEDERKRMIGTWLDNLDILNFRCFGGRSPFAKNFRALVAGGGTGDGTVYLGLQLRHTDAQIVHLDVSASSIEIARRRCEIHGLAGIRFVQGSLLDLPSLDLGRFDYINCVGVLHHLADPDAGLRALLGVLHEGGAMALLVYGRYGRTGVYQLQELLRRINRDQADESTAIRNTREVLARLPRTNWFKRGEDLHSDHTAGGDAGLYDLLLHSQDRAFTVPELYEWLADRHGLHLHFSDLHRGSLPYDPATFLDPSDQRLAGMLAALPMRERQSIAELWGGDLTRHSFYATREPDTQAPYGDVDCVPRIPWETYPPQGGDFAALIEKHGDRPFVLQHPPSGLTRVMEPSPLAAAIFRNLDGTRSFRDIFARVRGEPRFTAQPPTDAQLFAAFEPWFDALSSIERLVLLRSVPGWPMYAP